MEERNSHSHDHVKNSSSRAYRLYGEHVDKSRIYNTRHVANTTDVYGIKKHNTGSDGVQCKSKL
jgi:hypothetical protein